MDKQNNTDKGGQQPQYRVKIDGELVSFNDPVVTGQQLLLAAGKRPPSEHIVFEWLKDGQLEEIRPEETTDLRKPGIEKFVTFKSDRSYRFFIDDRQIEWGAQFITGLKLKKLAGVDSAKYDVWQEVRKSDDKKIGDADRVDLDDKGVERFFTAMKTTTEGLCAEAPEEVLPAEDFRYLVEKESDYIVVKEKNHVGVIFNGFPLPEGKFDADVARVLVLLPANYPDVAPDMFFTDPWLKLSASGSYPRQANQPLQLAGTRWQRWSRHNREWRIGKDGIWTMLKRIEHAIEVAN